MHSNIVEDREEAAKELLTTLQLHGKRVGAKLAEILGPLLEAGEALPDYLLMQRLVARELRTRLSELLAADAAYRALVEQLEGGTAGDGDLTFLTARRSKAEAEREQAIAAFDESYTSSGGMLEALYGLAGEEEIAEQLRPRVLAGAVEQPRAVPAVAEIDDPPEGEGEANPIERRILARKAERPGLSQWHGIRIFRRRRR